MPKGIRDSVAIVGMGCTQFGELWDKSASDLIVDAVKETLGVVPGLEPHDPDAYWLGTMGSNSGIPLAKALKTRYKPITRVENMCATGSEAFRAACYAVAAGASDVAMAVGVEKLKDSRASGLVIPDPIRDGTFSEMTAPALFSMIVPAYCKKYGVTQQEMKKVLSRIAWKNHQNGSKNPRAQFQNCPDMDTIINSPTVAGELGLFDCSGVADGAAAAVIVPANRASEYCEHPLYVKALSVSTGSGQGTMSPEYDFTTFPEVAESANRAYEQAGINQPSQEVDFAEVHDCFTPTELVLMEDLGFSRPGEGWRDVLAGRFDLDGDLPINPDGGLKSFGHPVGASGLRMLFEVWLQLTNSAGDRQIPGVSTALTNNLGGQPGECVSFVGIFGSEPG